MSEKNELTIVEPIDKEEIKNQIYELRGYKIMLDRDIATYFGVTTGNLRLGTLPFSYGSMIKE